MRVEKRQRCPYANSDNGKERGKDAPDPPLVESEDGYPAPGILFFHQKPGDQVSRDDEEDIDPDEAAGKGIETGVVGDNGDNSQGAQPIYVRSVTHSAR